MYSVRTDGEGAVEGPVLHPIVADVSLLRTVTGWDGWMQTAMSIVIRPLSRWGMVASGRPQEQKRGRTDSPNSRLRSKTGSTPAETEDAFVLRVPSPCTGIGAIMHVPA